MAIAVYLLVHAATAFPVRAALPVPAALSFLPQPLSGEAWTVNGEAYWLDAIKLSTPREPEAAEPEEQIYQFESRPSALRFSEIEEILLSRVTTRWVGSRPEEMECYRLGSVRRAVPPPPNWRRTIGQIPPWRRAEPTAGVDHLPYLNQAVFCWAEASASDRGGEGAEVYLFRQALMIAEPGGYARATLRVASNAELQEATLNEFPLHLARVENKSLAEFEVTPLIQAGANILAFRVRQRTGAIEPAYGLAFHLELQAHAADASRPRFDADAMLVAGRNGDRLWGRLENIEGDRLRMVTPYGRYGAAWADTIGVLFPAGWRPKPATRGWMARLGLGGSSEATDAGNFWGLPLDILPDPPQDCLLLTDGRMTTAKPSYVRDGSLYFEGGEGKQYSLPMEQVLGIYPPRGSARTFRRPSSEDAPLYCELTTTNGDRVSGFLRQISGKDIVVESTNGNILDFNPKWVANIRFPYHAPPAPTSRGPVGLIAQASGQEAFRETFETDARRVQGAIFAIGADQDHLSLRALGDAEALTPQRYPVIVSVDPVGEYVHTINEPGDAQGALLGYLEQGGVLLALSRGGAFRSALMRRGQGFRRAPAENLQPNLLEEVGLMTLRPAGRAPSGVMAEAFNHPPNAPQELFFQRGSGLPQGLLGLPRRIALYPMLSARFYPMVSRNRTATVIYEMRDEGGRVYGPGLSLVPKGRGTIVLIDHLLWNSRPDGRSFDERILPTLLRWALDTTNR